MWNLTYFSLEIVLVSVQDRCTICAKRTIGSEIILDAPDGTPRLRGSCGISLLFCLETVLVLVQDRCMVCTRRTIGSEIILDATDGTTRYKAQVEAHFSLFRDSANLDVR